MKGIILAGGTGSRLRPLTHTRPKQLLPIANEPAMEYALRDLVDAGIDEIGIILGGEGTEEIQECFGDGDDWGVDITYVVQGEPLGLAHAVGCVEDFVDGEPFVVYLGDILLQEGVDELVETFDPGTHDATVGLKEVEDPSRYGIASVDEDGNVVRLVEKPEDPPSTLGLVGVYVFTAEIFRHIEAVDRSWRGEYEITEAIQQLIEAGNSVQGHVVDGWWKDAGVPEDVLHANALVLDERELTVRGTIEDGATVWGRVAVGDRSTIRDGATVRGPVSIGADTTIGPDAYVGPYTSIGDRSRIDNAHIESSIVGADATINCDRHIVDSLIGRQSSIVSGNGSKPDGDRLVVGQKSSLEL